MAKSYVAAAAKDREVANGLEVALKDFKAKPQAFNGPLGFIFFGWINDTDRNALLCASAATLQASQGTNADTALALVHLAQDASTLIYTVSENANSLYVKYLGAQAQLTGQATDALQRCGAILKKNSTTPKR